MYSTIDTTDTIVARKNSNQLRYIIYINSNKGQRMNDFFCNKRYDISFLDFYRMIKLCLPSNYEARDTRGLYKSDYQPCNIIAIKQKDCIDKPEEQIYCWLGQKGLTVLADTTLTVSLCIEVLKNVQQNPDDYKVLSYDTDKLKPDCIETNEDLYKSYLVYKQINANDNTTKYLIREYNGDEVQIDFFSNPDSLRLSGAITSLFTYVQLLIEKNLEKFSE